MVVKLDAYDRKILYELDRNARISTSELAKKIKKSKQFVDYRIKRLEQERVILGYVSVIDYSRLGYISMRIYFKLHNITPEEQREMEEELIKDKEVWWLVTLEGPWDIAYAMAVKNVLEFYDYWDKIMKKYRKFILKRSVVVYTHIRQYPKSYLVGEENRDEGTLVGASKNIARMGGMDKEILKIVSDNARLPLVEIGSMLKTSSQVVKGRLKRLEKEGVVLGYRALIDVSFLGYRYYKAYINLLNTERLKGLEYFCFKHPNILNVNRTIGGRDFEIELQAKSFDEFEGIMNEIRTNFPGMIDEYEFVIAREEKKMVYFPFE